MERGETYLNCAPTGPDSFERRPKPRLAARKTPEASEVKLLATSAKISMVFAQ